MSLVNPTFIFATKAKPINTDLHLNKLVIFYIIFRYFKFLNDHVKNVNITLNKDNKCNMVLSKLTVRINIVQG